MSVAVVGSGLAGLSAAIEAAGRGADVTLYDARASIGGRARTRERDGFLLNEGPHTLYVDGAATQFLRGLGRVPSGGAPDAGAGVGTYRSMIGPMPTGAWSLLRTPLLKGSRIAFAKLFARLPRLDPADYAAVTVDDAITDLVGRGAAAEVAHALFRLSTYGNDPAVASADAGVRQLQYALEGGVRYLDGGWQVMVEHLRAEAESRRVDIVSGAKVESVRCLPAGEVALEVGGTVRRHGAAVLAPGGPRQVAQMVGDAVPAAERWAADARASTVASLDVGLGCGWGSAVPFALGIDEPMYLSVHAPVGRLAPVGRCLVHVARYHHPDESPDGDADRQSCEDLLDRVRPGWRDDAVHVGFHHRLVASSDQPRASAGGLAGRPGPEVSSMRNVTIAGDWVGPEGLLADASVASGRAAARLATAGLASSGAAPVSS